jgi:hypothetical protein
MTITNLVVTSSGSVDIIFDDTMVYIYVCYLHLQTFSILGVLPLLHVLSGMISLAHIVSLIKTFTLCTLSTFISLNLPALQYILHSQEG